MKQDLSEIVFILGRSGPTNGLESDAIGGISGEMERHEVAHYGVDADGEEHSTHDSMVLLDAIGKTINDVGLRLSETPEDQRPSKVIIIITTDGREDSSREFGYDEIKGMITHQAEKYGWEFILMGSNIDVAFEASRLGIRQDRAYSNNPCKVGAQDIHIVAYSVVDDG
jgi:hypothetical protein